MNLDETNPLAAGTPAAAGEPAPHPILGALDQAHSGAKAIYEHSSSSLKRLDSVRRELTKLVSLGDAVTTDNVVDAAGHLVAVGLGPTQLAGLLADMPTTSGPAIRQWLETHVEDITQREQTAMLANNLSRHEMGVSALRLLAAHGAGSVQAPAPAPAPSPLTAGAPTLAN